MLVVFAIVEYEISLFLISFNFVIVDNHKSLIFSVLWKRFLAFLVNVPICLSNKPQTRCFPDGCHENVSLATFRPNSPRPLWLEIFQQLAVMHFYTTIKYFYSFFLRFGRKVTIISGLISTIVACAISVSIPADKNPG